MCEQKPKFYLWKDLSQQHDKLHLSDGVPPAQGIFLADSDTLILTFACVSSRVFLYDKFVITGVLLKHISTLK